MRLREYYWAFESVIPIDMCDKIIEHGLQQGLKTGKVGGEGNESEVDIKIRDSEITWLHDKWILAQIYPYVHSANKEAKWNFQWNPPHQLQFTKYGEGQFYNWHRDSLAKPYRNGEIRKLSLTVNLSDGYEGGDFLFDFQKKYGETNPRICKKLRPKGSVVIFPSHIWHKVETVTSGTRYSLVMWLMGRPWV